jgi:hypothetical protein
MIDAGAFRTEAFTPRKNLLLSAWLARQFPERDYLLGSVLCTTSRWLLFGDTGVGKTLLAMEIGAAVAAGRPLLGWEGRRRSRVMYLDGEMPAETFKERLQVIAERYGKDILFYGYNRDDLDDRDQMPPLNTEDGEKWLMNEIEAVKPDLIIFDSVMSLLIGLMSEEESWAPVKHLVRHISSRRIAQIWLHHTGHDTSKSYGTKTREWEMDTVIALASVPDDDKLVAMEFRKARLRTPQNWEQYKSATICRADNGWTEEGPLSKPKSGKTSEDVAKGPSGNSRIGFDGGFPGVRGVCSLRHD